MYALQKDIEVYSLEKTYSHRLTQSISSYLFEDLKVIKNIAPKTNKNRTNKLENKKYICIHDTADVEYSALSWNKTVFDNFYEKRNIPYNASYQYVVGNDGIYQNIPDEEIAFHAGDGSEEGFKLIKSGVLGNNINPIITISDDGYYEIDGKKSIISAPKDEDKVLTTLDINNFGIKCEVIGGEYYLGLTWYSKVYKKIANRGGNRNSIGIESCLDEGSNIHLTWQRLAKLVAYLLNKYKLKLRDIVPHQFFSGKLCPHTIIENGCWNYLVELIKAEKNILSLKNKGYSFRIKNQKEIICQKDNILLEYQIEIKKENNKETLKFYSYFTN
ncbi:MAG: N-acetylmuramoyl-L-alanine amidase [Clostridia bacterium]|nr:N-acetylmuramoyl-L-alanine amidase [Clostridia bacterium]